MATRSIGSKLGVVAVSVGLVLGTPAAVQAALADANDDPPAKASEPGLVDPSQKVTFYLGLKRDDAGVKKQLKVRPNPKSAYYRNWLSQRQVAKTYGATDATIKKVKRYLGKRGVVTRVDESRVFARISGTVQTIQDVFKTQLGQVNEQGLLLVGANSPPVIPAAIRSVIPQYLFMQARQLPVAQSAPANAHGQASFMLPPQNQGTPVDACEAVASDPAVMTFGQATKAYTIDKVRARLGYGLQQKGEVRPKAPRLGIISLGDGFSQESSDAAAQCFGWKAKSTRVVKSDGVSSPLPQTLEGSIDQQLALATLWRTTAITAYQAAGSVSQIFLPLSTALNDRNLSPVLSISYGACEQSFRDSMYRPARQLSEAILMRLGLVGTTVVVASGDYGSSACAQDDAGLQASVDYPASSPYVTAVGGTRLILDKANHRAGEVVWNDSEYIGLNDMAGGGGVSNTFKRPWWQTGRTGSAANRTLPDIAAHASGAPGWPLFVQVPGQLPVLLPVEGTSAAAPLTAAVLAMMSAKELTEGRPKLGFREPGVVLAEEAVRAGLFRYHIRQYRSRRSRLLLG